jgi:hypothetical protein
MVFKLSEIISGLFIPDPGSRIQRSKRHQIPDPGSRIRIRNTDIFKSKIVVELLKKILDISKQQNKRYGTGLSHIIYFMILVALFRGMSGILI